MPVPVEGDEDDLPDLPDVTVGDDIMLTFACTTPGVGDEVVGREGIGIGIGIGSVGTLLGVPNGDEVGALVGLADGDGVGALEGLADGDEVGALVGCADGDEVGALVAFVGRAVGDVVGAQVLLQPTCFGMVYVDTSGESMTG